MSRDGLRVVIDTDVLVSTAAQLDRDPLPLVWAKVRAKEIVPFTTDALLRELVGVVHREKVLRTLPRLADAFPRFFMEYLSQATRLASAPDRFELQSDPKDSELFNVSIAADAFALISFDAKHVLAIADAMHPQHAELQSLAPRLRVLHPKDLATALVQMPDTSS